MNVHLVIVLDNKSIVNTPVSYAFLCSHAKQSMTTFQQPAKKENERMSRQFYLQMFAQPSKALPRDTPSYLTVAAPVPISDHSLSPQETRTWPKEPQTLYRLPAQPSIHDAEILPLLRSLDILIHISRSFPHLHLRTHPHRLLHRQPQILLHQLHPETAVVVVLRRRSGADPGDGVVDLAAPTSAAAAVDQFAQGVRVETPSQTEVHGFGGCDVGDGEEVVVRQFS